MTERSRQYWEQSLELLIRAGDVAAWELEFPQQSGQQELTITEMLERSILHPSEELEAWLGSAPDLPQGYSYHSWLQFYHPDDCALVYEARMGCLEHRQEVLEARYRLRRPDGQWRWVLSRGCIAETDAFGNIRKLAGVMMDVSQQRHTEEELYRIGQSLRQAARAAHLCLWSIRMDDQVPGWGEQDWLTRIREGVLQIRSGEDELRLMHRPRYGADWLRQMHLDDLSRVWEVFHATLIGESPYFDVEYRTHFNPLIQEDIEGWVWIRVHGEVTRRNADGLALELSGAVTDVTHRKEAEAALEISRKHTALAVQSANLGLWSMDFPDNSEMSTNERILAAHMTVADSLLARLGYEEEDIPVLTSRIWLSLVHPDDLPVVRSALNNLLRGAHPFFEWQYRVRRKDGSWRWLHDRAGVTEFNSYGLPLQVCGAFFDITRRRAMEEEAKTSRRKLAAIFLGAELGSWELVLPKDFVIDNPENANVADIISHSRFTISDGFASRMGYSRSDIARFSGPELLQLCHPDDIHTFVQVLFSHILGSPDVLEMTFRLRRKDQNWCWVTTRGGVVERNVSGQSRVLAGTIIDATKNKQAEIERDAAQERLSLAARAARLGVWTWDLQADTWTCDEGMDLGYDPRHWVQGTIPWRTLLHPEDLDRNDEVMQSYIEGQLIDYDQILRLRHRDGSWRYFHFIGRLTGRDQSGRPHTMVGIHMDISELMLTKAETERQKIRMEQVVETIDGGIWDWDVAADTMFFSPNFLVMLGYAADAFPQSPQVWKELTYPNDWRKLEQQINATLYDAGRGDRHELTFRARTRDGSVRWLLVRYVVVARDANGQALRAVGLSTDVTALRTMRKELEIQAERMQLAITAAHDVVWDWDVRLGTVTFDGHFSPAMTPDTDEPSGCSNWECLIHPDDLERVLTEYRRYCESAKHGNRCEVTFRLRLAQDHWVLNRAVVVERDDGGQALRLVGVYTDITDLHRAQDTLREQLNYDPLTNLHSRAYLERELERLQLGQDDPVCVIACDLDGLKIVNDSLGHAAGDQMLIQAASLLKKVPRTTDVVARTGGDEMVLVLPRCGEVVGKRLLNEVKALFEMHNAETDRVPIGISLGLATANLAETPVERLLVEADQQMYADKLAHREQSYTRLRTWLAQEDLLHNMREENTYRT